MTFVRPAAERREGLTSAAIDLRERRAASEPAPTPSSDASTMTVTAVDLQSIPVVAAFLAGGYIVLMVACITLWVVASAVGVVANVESFIRDTGFDTFRFAPVALLRAMTLAGVVLVAAATVAAALAIVLYNRLAERLGGFSVTVVTTPAPFGEREVQSGATLVPCPPMPARSSPSTDASTTSWPSGWSRSHPPS